MSIREPLPDGKKEMQRTVGRQSAPHSSHAASLSDNSVAQSGYPVKADFVQAGGAGVICTKKKPSRPLSLANHKYWTPSAGYGFLHSIREGYAPVKADGLLRMCAFSYNRAFRHACAERSPPDTIPDTEKRRILIFHDSPSGAVDGT